VIVLHDSRPRASLLRDSRLRVRAPRPRIYALAPSPPSTARTFARRVVRRVASASIDRADAIPRQRGRALFTYSVRVEGHETLFKIAISRRRRRFSADLTRGEI
jgi:hypothetical protein